MNALERRVTDALRAYGNGLTMSTHDIDRLERGLEDQRHAAAEAGKDARRRRRGRIFQGAVAACAVTGVVLGALALRDGPNATPQPAAPPQATATQLEGIWRVEGSDWLWKIAADGEVVQSNRPDILTTSNPSLVFRPVAGGFAATDPDNPGDCESWSITVTPDGRMRALEGGGPAGACASTTPTSDASGATTWALTRLSPRSVEGAAATSYVTPEQAQRLVDRAKLKGTWLLRYGATLLTVDSEGRYALMDLGATTTPVTGSVVTEPDGVTTFRPDQARPAGCTAVYDSVTYTNAQLVTALAQDSCNRIGATTNDAWIRLN